MTMKLYTGTKTVRATPMTRLEYNALRGWSTPADENPAEAGYIVEYTDGGKPNHPNYAGYVSWSPADVFNRAYQPSETWLERVIAERNELNEKIKALSRFIASPAALELDDEPAGLLTAQRAAMAAYAEILTARIILAGKGKP